VEQPVQIRQDPVSVFSRHGSVQQPGRLPLPMAPAGMDSPILAAMAKGHADRD
jgi:hypothetical protein